MTGWYLLCLSWSFQLLFWCALSIIVNWTWNCSVVLFPVAVTFFITWWFIQFVDGFFSPLYERLGIDIFGKLFSSAILLLIIVWPFYGGGGKRGLERQRPKEFWLGRWFNLRNKLGQCWWIQKCGPETETEYTLSTLRFKKITCTIWKVFPDWQPFPLVFVCRIRFHHFFSFCTSCWGFCVVMDGCHSILAWGMVD